ncbi:hypothetical protein GGX14DRAFT_564445 [Mycena pura]|uniref:Uncharacterized protein n=1 Tax=Mycena pura TaxID=153505 RepID=A0AAD6VIT6_9AGAR|nr:hypothetical protein GGX14DRAFT_564445 [Mycena pura]
MDYLVGCAYTYGGIPALHLPYPAPAYTRPGPRATAPCGRDIDAGGRRGAAGRELGALSDVLPAYDAHGGPPEYSHVLILSVPIRAIPASAATSAARETLTDSESNVTDVGSFMQVTVTVQAPDPHDVESTVLLQIWIAYYDTSAAFGSRGCMLIKFPVAFGDDEYTSKRQRTASHSYHHWLMGTVYLVAVVSAVNVWCGVRDGHMSDWGLCKFDLRAHHAAPPPSLAFLLHSSTFCRNALIRTIYTKNRQPISICTNLNFATHSMKADAVQTQHLAHPARLRGAGQVCTRPGPLCVLTGFLREQTERVASSSMHDSQYCVFQSRQPPLTPFSVTFQPA